MTSKERVLSWAPMGVLLLLLALPLALVLASPVSHAALPGEDEVQEVPTQIFYEPNDDQTILNVSVWAFPPAKDAPSGTDTSQAAQEALSSCGGTLSGLIRCSAEATAQKGSAYYKVIPTPIQNANLSFFYRSNVSTQLLAITECNNLNAQQGIRYEAVSGSPTPAQIDYWFVQCKFPKYVYEGRTRVAIKIYYDPAGQQLNGKDLTPTSAEYVINRANVSTGEQLTAKITDMIRSVSEARYGTVPGLAFPCFGIFLLMGLLLASMYFAGKSPVSLLDITTPRLPAPKGVTAGGQVLAPFGYTEMKKTVKDKLAKSAAAIGITTGITAGRMAGNPELGGLDRSMAAHTPPSATLAGKDFDQMKAVQRGIYVAGLNTKQFNSAELMQLTRKSLYDYGEPEHRLVARIIDALRARGGRDALLALSIQDYVFGQRLFKSLEALTGHPDIGVRSPLHYAVTNTLGKAFSANRYALVGPLVAASVDSGVRTGRMVGRMGKAIVTETAPLARSVTRTTMEMLGGERAMEKLAQRGRVSTTADWVSKQLAKHPSQIVIGQMYPLHEKMGHLGGVLREEFLHNQEQYVLRQIYKKLGINFNAIGEEEISNMGHEPMDVLRKMGYFDASPHLAAIEDELKAILSKTTLTSRQKLDALLAIADREGAYVDPRITKLRDTVEQISTSMQPEYVKLVLTQQMLEEEARLAASISARQGAGATDAYVCHVGGATVRGPAIWETLVLRTMIWDAENGYLHAKAGIKDEIVSAHVNTINRLVSLDPTTAVNQLPEHMRNLEKLKKVAEQAKSEFLSLIAPEGKELYQKTKNKSMESASMAEIVTFMYGGNIPRTGEFDKKTGKQVWWGTDRELEMPKGSTLVDMKRLWLSELTSRDNLAIAQWVESRFTRSYSPAYRASLEAEANRMVGSSAWSVEQRANVMKKLFVTDELVHDMEGRFN